MLITLTSNFLFNALAIIGVKPVPVVSLESFLEEVIVPPGLRTPPTLRNDFLKSIV